MNQKQYDLLIAKSKRQTEDWYSYFYNETLENYRTHAITSEPANREREELKKRVSSYLLTDYRNLRRTARKNKFKIPRTRSKKEIKADLEHLAIKALFEAQKR